MDEIVRCYGHKPTSKINLVDIEDMSLVITFFTANGDTMAWTIDDHEIAMNIILNFPEDQIKKHWLEKSFCSHEMYEKVYNY